MNGDNTSTAGESATGDADGATRSDRVLARTDRRDYLKLLGSGAALTGVGAASLVGPAGAQTTTISSNQTGNHEGYFFSFWTNDEGTVTMDLESDGSYSVDWNNTGNFVCGKGWNPGSRRTVEYSADYNPNGNSYLCLYGWTTDPLVEYYVIEDHGTYRPEHTSHGTHQSDGGTYDLYESLREQQPSIEGTATFPQYWSIRQNTRTSGTITVGNHFDAWENAGLELGSHDYQIMATEGYQSSGSSSVTIGTAGGDDTPTPTPSGQGPVIGDNSNPAGDLDGDGRYEDVNGNGRLDSDDVVTFFDNMDAQAVTNDVGSFDYNQNGRIDFDDVVTLFEMM